MIYNVIKLIRDIASGGLTPSESSNFSAVFMAEALRQFRDVDNSIDLNDYTIPPQVARSLAMTLDVTPGAASKIAAAETGFDAVRIIFADKKFRATLRETARIAQASRAAEELIADAARIDELTQPSLPIKAAYKSAVSRPADSFPKVSEQFQVRHSPVMVSDDLQKTLPIPIQQIWNENVPAAGSKVQTITVGQLIIQLTEGVYDSQTNQILRNLAVSKRRIFILVLFHAFKKGLWTPSADWQPFFLIEVIRLLISLNANATAFDLASELINSEAHSKNLPEGERVRVVNLYARSCLRTGRTKEAVEVYLESYMNNMHRGDSAFNYLNAVYTTDLNMALSIATMLVRKNTILRSSEMIFVGDLLLHNGHGIDAFAAFHRAADDDPGGSEHLVGFANYALAHGNKTLWFSALQSYGQRTGLLLDNYIEDEKLAPFAFSATSGIRRSDILVSAPLISVIMTSYNSAETLKHAVYSVLAQDFTEFELIIVDDVSEDNSREIIQELAQIDRRVRFIFNECNIGTYAAKNSGIQISRGEFLTFHDSDDWMHPSRLSTQLKKMSDEVGCTTSQWLRMDAGGRIIVRRQGGYTHLNPASTMFRKKLVDEIGPFDYVRTGADSEYVTRMRLRYGWNSVLSMSDCVGIGLHHEKSLTQSGATAFDEHRYSAVRLEYTESWLNWHIARFSIGKKIELFAKNARPFDVPDSIKIDVISDRL